MPLLLPHVSEVVVEGTVLPQPRVAVAHLRLWRIPFFWREDDVAQALMRGLGGLATQVQVTIYRDIRTSAKESRNGTRKVGGYRKPPHCGGAALVHGCFTLRGRALVSVGPALGSFEIEASTQPQPLRFSERGANAVRTVAGSVFHPAVSIAPTDEAILRAVVSVMPDARNLVRLFCRASGAKAGSVPAGVEAVHFLLECWSDEDAATMCKGLHDTLLPASHEMPASLLTAGFTRDRTRGCSVYKPLFVPPHMHAREQWVWDDRVQHLRAANHVWLLCALNSEGDDLTLWHS